MDSKKADLTNRQADFQSQLENHWKIVLKVVGAFAWQREDQQDLAQEIAIQLWKAFPKYEPTRSFSTWMYQVALNVAISWSRKAKLRRRHAASEEDLDQVPAPLPEKSRSLELYQLIETLDDLDRALLLLYIEERSHQEIGEILGISTTNVATKLSRLKLRLRLKAARQEIA